MKFALITVFTLLLKMNISANDLPIRFYVANHKASCTGLTSQMCYLMKNSPNGIWQNYYNDIEGFNYEEGYEYEILVKKKVIENPPADGPAFVYKLVNVVKKTPTMVISLNYRKMLDQNEYYLKRIRVDNKLKNFTDGQNVYMTFILNDNIVRGMDGCNSFSGNVIINKDSISFSNFALSEMYCQEVKVDKIFNQLIMKVNRYRISGSLLKLFNGKKTLFEFSMK